MKLSKRTSLALTLFAALAITLQLTAQDNPKPSHKHQNYKLVDVGTFGGANTYLYSGPPSFGLLNSSGSSVGNASTTVPDPYPYCWSTGCVVYHAFAYDHGRLKDLGALPGTNSSIAVGINDNGEAAGISENGSIDPLTGYPETRAVVWAKGAITDLGTFGGNVSVASNINERGAVVGAAANAVPDSYASGLGPCFTYDCSPVATQLRAFLWSNGSLRDLGTLGGNDAGASVVNDSGQITGVSYTNTIPNATTGIPTQDPFFWDGRRMVDIGSLGGTLGWPWWMNSRGQVVGQSNLVGDGAHHAFLWDRGRLTDLGTLGGSDSGAYWINDNGDATGYGFLAGDQTYHGVLWKRGKRIDLGDLPGFPRSVGTGINSDDQIVGNVATADFSVFHAMLWEDGSIIDLNTFVPPGSSITLLQADLINDQGEILTYGTLSNGDYRVFMLYPDGDCDGETERRIAESQNASAVQPAKSGVTLPAFGKPADWLRNPTEKRFPEPGHPGMPYN